MDICLHDLVYDWAFYRFPLLLDDEEVFETLVKMIHNLLIELQRRERAGVFERMTRISSN